MAVVRITTQTACRDFACDFVPVTVTSEGMGYTERRLTLAAWVVLCGGLAICAQIMAAHLPDPFWTYIADALTVGLAFCAGWRGRDVALQRL